MSRVIRFRVSKLTSPGVYNTSHGRNMDLHGSFTNVAPSSLSYVGATLDLVPLSDASCGIDFIGSDMLFGIAVIECVQRTTGVVSRWTEC